jgi:hypothetical protein
MYQGAMCTRYTPLFVTNGSSSSNGLPLSKPCFYIMVLKNCSTSRNYWALRLHILGSNNSESIGVFLEHTNGYECFIK